MGRKIEKLKLNHRNNDQNEFAEIIKGYYRYASKREKLIDSLTPLFISFLCFSLLAIFETSNYDIFNLIDKINSVSLSVIAILAGFNTTSLSIIAASNKDVLKNLSLAGNNPDNNILKQVVTFFTYSIIIQIIILFIGTVLVILDGSATGIYQIIGISRLTAKILLSIFGSVWLTAILYCLMVSLRNIALLYRYIIHIGILSKKD